MPHSLVQGSHPRTSSTSGTVKAERVVCQAGHSQYKWKERLRSTLAEGASAISHLLTGTQGVLSQNPLAEDRTKHSLVILRRAAAGQVAPGKEQAARAEVNLPRQSLKARAAKGTQQNAHARIKANALPKILFAASK